MVASNNWFEIEDRLYEAMIGSCDFPDGVGLCLTITDAETGDEVLNICQVDSTKHCFVEAAVGQVPVAVMQYALEMFEKRVRLK